jgi:hypothetical protein
MVSQDKPAEQPIIVPVSRLSPGALSALIEEFVTRSGTDYGRREASLDEKCTAVRTQLKNGRAHITYDPSTQTCTIVLSDGLRTFCAGRQQKGTP